MKINQPIDAQGFELVRDKIGAILLDELTNQQVLQGFSEELEIYSERSVPADSVDQLYVNVLLAGAEYGQMTQKDAQGRTIFYIDVYTSSEATVGQSGGRISALRLHKFLGMVMYIFRAPYYRFMDLPAGLIGGTYVENFSVLDPHQKEDTDFTRFGRVQLAVRIQEDTEAWQGIEILGNNSAVKLDLTEKGYKFVYNKIVP